MKRKQDMTAPVNAARPRSALRDMAVLAGFFALPALLIIWVAHRSPRPLPGKSAVAPPAASSVHEAQASAQPQPVPPPSRSNPLAQTNPPTPPLEVSATPAISNPPPGAPLPPSRPAQDAQQLVASLTELDLSAGAISPEQAAQWKQALQNLIQGGAASVPAIAGFLLKNVDVDLDQIKDGNLLGYATVRLALLDVLRQIPGPESLATSVQILKTTADPREIANLAKNLEQQAPGQHRLTAVAAAREALGEANRGQLESHDAGPLFEVLQHYGGPSAVVDLEQVASKWNFYSTIALGGLDGGAGIPALARMAQDASIPNVMASRMLAQLAGQQPEAKAALVERVRSNKIPYPAWSAVQAALSGELIEYAAPILGSVTGSLTGPNARTYHINYGNQNYRTVVVSSDWPQPRVQQQIALIDQLIAVDTNLESLSFLQAARLALAAQLTPK